ncbi:hypothetical protein [Methylomonas methanica]|uniref:Uncharacterized protein n=1 Tax=Methylomonas methanica TaxID=421 RepID=A0A177MXF3_METMH|nr:hypothetical protein [Methylomonas methanica]OAI10064.1 hypothetical protein A1332_23985 [Methylomonas methanica]
MKDNLIKYSFQLVVFIFIVYSSSLILITWSNPEISIDKSGVFGDSFGALTALFTGLAFAGTLRTLQIQSEELKLQRTEIERAASAQEITARLTATTTLLSEYNSRLKTNEELIKQQQDQMLSGIINQVIQSAYEVSISKLEEENLTITQNKYSLIRELESILTET